MTVRAINYTDRPQGWFGCWLWKRAIASNGYGATDINGKTTGAHVAAYRTFRGLVPEGKVLHHLCKTKHCINPWHLKPVTHRENLMLDDTPAARNAAKTHCPRGHPYDEANTCVSVGRRHCRTCGNERRRKR